MPASAPYVSNCYDPAAVRPVAKVERVLIHRPACAWTYSHHPHLSACGGRLVAIWSSGRQHEDDAGQRVLLSTSTDFADWSRPRPLFDTLVGRHGEAVLTAAGLYRHGGTLVAYAGRFEYQPQALAGGRRLPGDVGHRDTGLVAVVSGDGDRWSAPRDLGLPLVPNHGPQPSRSGRLILSGNVLFPYSDDPSGLTGWRLAGIYPPDMAGGLYDDSEGFWLVRQRQGWPCGLCEGSFFQTDDGLLHMMLRSGTERLWQTWSADDGANWSAPAPSDFTDNGTKFHFGRLPDGRFYYVGCPDPEPRGARCPLVASLSTDGERFARHWILADASTPYRQRHPGLHKGGEYGYPHTCVDGGWLYVIVSRQKEAIEVLRVRLAAL